MYIVTGIKQQHAQENIRARRAGRRMTDPGPTRRLRQTVPDIDSAERLALHWVENDQADWATFEEVK